MTKPTPTRDHRIGDYDSEWGWRYKWLRSKLHRLVGCHWYLVNGSIPGRMCYFCGKQVEHD